jgi:hypothetical protein
MPGQLLGENVGQLAHVHSGGRVGCRRGLRLGSQSQPPGFRPVLFFVL